MRVLIQSTLIIFEMNALVLFLDLDFGTYLSHV